MINLAQIMPTSRVLYDEPMHRHTTFGIGGAAELFVEPADQLELTALLKYAHSEQLPLHFIGSGSNCLVADEGLPGITISMAKSFKSITVKPDGRVWAEAGVMLGHMVKLCVAQDLTGLESLVGVPGTLGGALRANAGAYGSEIAKCIETVDVVTLTGERKTYARDELEFSYRSSSLTDDELIISATFVFAKGDNATIAAKRLAASEARNKHQP